MSRRLLSSQEVLTEFNNGLTYRELDHWVRKGIITPAIRADGSGTRRYFTETNIQEIRVCVALRWLGVSLWSIKDIIAFRREVVGSGPATLTIDWDSLL